MPTVEEASDLTGDQKAIVAQIADANRQFYSTPEAKGFLNVIEHTFEDRWIYLFELFQNALDCGARQISVMPIANGLVFQHDGTEPLTKDSVLAMSRIFLSTKGARTVGFMGIGFKSVFRRFLQAKVSGFGWKFGYNLHVETGAEFGDKQINYLGAVLPAWDDDIRDAESPYTTRFELSERISTLASVAGDVSHAVPSLDPTILALFAAAGLRRIELLGTVWILETKIQDGFELATASSTESVHYWRLFRKEYQPSKSAVARFLERRRLQPKEDDRERVYADAARSRKVVGIVPVTEDDVPLLPETGRVYASLPTSATLPFRLHVHADWLVNVSRSGLPSLEDNEWQHEIIDNIPQVVADYLVWLCTSRHKVSVLRDAYKLVALPSKNSSNPIEARMATVEWLQSLNDVIRSLPVLPAFSAGRLIFVAPDNATVVPHHFHEIARRGEWLPELLFGGVTVAEEILGNGLTLVLTEGGRWNPLSPVELETHWAGGLQQWWMSLNHNEPEQWDVLFEVWNAIGRLAKANIEWARLPCVHTSGGNWVSATKTEYMTELGPNPAVEAEGKLFAFLEPFYPAKDRSLPTVCFDKLNATDKKEPGASVRRSANEWLRKQATQIKLEDIVANASTSILNAEIPHFDYWLLLAQWSRKRHRPSLVSHVVAMDPNTVVSKREEAVIAEPYVERGHLRRTVHAGWPVIVKEYADTDPFEGSARDWRAFFESVGARGPLRVKLQESHVYSFETKKVADFAGWTPQEVPLSSSNRNYTLVEHVLAPAIPEIPTDILAEWLESEYSALHQKHFREVHSFYRTGSSKRAKKLASWVGDLQQRPWVPTSSGQRLRPAAALAEFDPLRSEYPVAAISAELTATLTQAGLRFGHDIPRTPDIRRLQASGHTMTAIDLANSIRGTLDSLVATPEDQVAFSESLDSISLPLSDSVERVPLRRIATRVGPGIRSSLGIWVRPIDAFDAALRDVLQDPRMPTRIPETTTGRQALAFLRDVWRRAVQPEPGLAQRVRDYLPLAYGYVLDDLSADEALATSWSKLRSEARIFGITVSGERIWASCIDSPPVYDDLHEPVLRQFFQSAGNNRSIFATPAHLGLDEAAQQRIASELGLVFLSKKISLRWDLGPPVTKLDRLRRFETMVQIVNQTSERSEAEQVACSFETLSWIKLRDDTTTIAIPARLNNDTISVTGRPSDFAVEVTGILLDRFRPPADGRLTARLGMMVAAIDDETVFQSEAMKFARDFTPHFVPSFDSGQESNPIKPLVVIESPEIQAPLLLENGAVREVENQRTTFEADVKHLERQIFSQKEEETEAKDTDISTMKREDERSRVPLPQTPITPQQIRRGELGEREFLRRVKKGAEWSRLLLLADRTFDKCGYDFLCSENDKEVKVEVKTFTANGSVFVTPNEWDEARKNRSTYYMVGFLDDGQPPETWVAYLIADPYPLLERETKLQLIANLSAPASRLFPIPDKPTE